MITRLRSPSGKAFTMGLFHWKITIHVWLYKQNREVKKAPILSDEPLYNMAYIVDKNGKTRCYTKGSVLDKINKEYVRY